jgi:hypothetical protein
MSDRSELSAYSPAMIVNRTAMRNAANNVNHDIAPVGIVRIDSVVRTIGVR